MPYGQIIILNGAPRSGKSSIAKVIAETYDGLWINLGVDAYMRMIPQQLQPGIGLRPGGERPDLEPVIVTLYQAMYASIAAHSRMGVNVVTDVGHHDAYAQPRNILARCAALLCGLPVLFVGVQCPLDEILERRKATGYPSYLEDGQIAPAILRWQDSVHAHGLYDMIVDTSLHTPEACAAQIKRRLDSGVQGDAFARIANKNPSFTPEEGI